MPTVSDGSVDLWYEIRGRGPVVVLTGGFGLLHDQFHAVVDALAETHTVVNWHYRGSGRSTRTGPDGSSTSDPPAATSIVWRPVSTSVSFALVTAPRQTRASTGSLARSRRSDSFPAPEAA